MSLVEKRLTELGISLPSGAVSPNEVANDLYDAHVQPSCIVGGILYLAGQVPISNGVEMFKGRFGETLTIEDGYQAARLCAINALGDMKRALGTLDRVVQIVRLVAFINATNDFTQHPQISNGASDLMIEVFGERGRHPRATLGVTGMASGHSIETVFTVHVTEEGTP